jgi:hypothetical protein
MHLLPTRQCTTFLAAVALVAAATADANLVVVPTLTVNSLTHTYSGLLPFGPVARDSFTIGDGNYTGGGAFTIPSIANGDTVAFRIQAPAGKKFVVHNGAAFFGFSLRWSAASDAVSTTGGTFAFENLVGVAPTNTYSVLSVGNAGNAIQFQLQFNVNGPFEFTAIDLMTQVQSSPSAGPRSYGSVLSTTSPAFSASKAGVNQLLMSIEPSAVPEASAFLMVGGVVSAMALARSARRR